MTKTKEKPKPNLFIVGAPKCGTSALAHYLNQHRDVFISNPKEPFYWSFDFPALRERLEIKSLDDYMGLFQNARDNHKTLGEGSTLYLRSYCAIENIIEFNPDAKFIAMLRNPVEVAHAFHSELLFSCWEDVSDFEQAWRMQKNRRTYTNMVPPACPAHQLLQYSKIAMFSEQIENFFRIVPENQRKVIIFDDFVDDTKAAFDSTLEFLGLEPFQLKSFEKVNGSHTHRFPWLSKMILDPPAPIRPVVDSLRVLARRKKDGWIQKAKTMLRTSSRREPLSPEFHAELCEHFAEDVFKLSDLLHRNLTHWVNHKIEDKTEDSLVEVGS